MALGTKPRWDKTNPYVGNHRAFLAADVPEAFYNKVVAVGKNSQGAVVIGGGQTGVDGLLIIPVGADIHGELLDGGINNLAGDPTDVGQLGEITNFEGFNAGTPTVPVTAEAGKIYYGHPDGSVLTSTGPGAVVVGRTAEKDRLIVNVNVGGPGGGIQNTVPVGLAGSGGTGTATLAWTPVKGATGYKIQKSSDGTTFAAGVPATSVNPTVVETGLAAGTWYFKVLATVGGVDSAYSAASGPVTVS